MKELSSLRAKLVALQVPGSASRHSFVQACDVDRAIVHPADSTNTAAKFLQKYKHGQ